MEGERKKEDDDGKRERKKEKFLGIEVEGREKQWHR